MKTVYGILEELNLENGSNYKASVLKQYEDHDTLKRVLILANDKANYNFGVGKRSLEKIELCESDGLLDLNAALDILENEFCTRAVTGNAALSRLGYILSNANEEDSEVIKKIISRDLKINFGKTQINKVFKNLIKKPMYMRCDVYSKKTASKIKFPAFVQKKADGTYREFSVGDVVSCNSRSGEDYVYPNLFESFNLFDDGHYYGELTVYADDKIIGDIIKKMESLEQKGEDSSSLRTVVEEYNKTDGEYILPRKIGNGLINSDDVPYDNLILELWDYVEPDDYNLVFNKQKAKIKYGDRLQKLKDILSTNTNNKIRLIETEVVNSIADALDITSKWMKLGYEGAIIKNKDLVFKDGTSTEQLKLKLEIDCEMRFTEFVDGNIGSKNEKYFSAVKFQNDEGSIKGQIGVTTMTEELRDWFHNNREQVIGSICTIQFNDLDKAEGHNYYALSHPRFIELRKDKDKTDTLDDVKKLREMASELTTRG